MLLKIIFCPLLRFVEVAVDAVTPATDVIAFCVAELPLITKFSGYPLTVSPGWSGGGDGPVPLGSDVTCTLPLPWINYPS